MSIKAVVAPALFAASLLAGCVTEGRDFKSDTTWIKDGKTTKQDVEMMLKSPESVGNSSGKPTWTYLYGHYPLFGKRYQKELKVYWKADGTVDSYSFTSSFPEDTGKAGAQQAPAAPSQKSDY